MLITEGLVKVQAVGNTAQPERERRGEERERVEGEGRKTSYLAASACYYYEMTKMIQKQLGTAAEFKSHLHPIYYNFICSKLHSDKPLCMCRCICLYMWHFRRHCSDCMHFKAFLWFYQPHQM